MATVLVVDDSNVMRRLLLASLVKAGLKAEQLVEASDGREALEAIRSHGGIDLVMCDLCMPNMDGVELLDALREDQLLEGLSVVIVTGDADESRAQEALAHGAQRLLPKPFSPQLLKETLTELLGASSSNP